METPLTSEDEAIQTPSKPWASGLEALYKKHYQPLVRLAHFLSGSNAFAEDVVQEAFVGLNRRWDEVDNASSYLRTSVVNACRSGARRGRLLRLHLPAPSAKDPAPDEMTDALSKLPYRQKAALVLRYYEDMSLDQIAAALDCRRGTAGSLIHRGLAELRKAIEP